VTSGKDDLHQGLTDDEIKGLFDRFSLPMVRPCLTSRHKQNAIGISRILWLRPVTGTDTKENIYRDLNRVFADSHDSNVAVGSMYFLKMKTELVDAEIQKLRDHYGHEDNLNRLADWNFATLNTIRLSGFGGTRIRSGVMGGSSFAAHLCRC